METMIQSERRLDAGEQYTQLGQETSSKNRSPSDYYHTFPINYDNNMDHFIAQSWIPEPSVSWNTIRESQNQWQNATSNDNPLVHQAILYPHHSETPTLSSSYDFEIASKIEGGNVGYQPCIRPINQIAEDYGDDFLSQTPQSTHNEPYSMNRILPSNDAGYHSIPPYSEDLSLGTSHPTWIPFTGHSSPNPVVTTPSFPSLDAFTGTSLSFSLDWSTSEQAPETFLNARKPSVHAAAPKRKYLTPSHAAKKVEPDCPLEECVGVFENAPGALATVKKRKKLDAPVRKAARDVRKAGACHQCRFRKRTCSTGTPCGSCLKNGKGLHEIKCQRESPFVGRPMHEYFEHSSTRRVVSFGIMIPSNVLLTCEEEFVFVDGIGRLSHPIKLRARRKALTNFSPAEQTTIRAMQDKQSKSIDYGSVSITLLEDDETLGTRVEQWAVEYASKFVHAAGPKFQSTTIAVIIGTAYVKKGLPESALVAAMLRVASIAFILRAGVKCTNSSYQPTSPFRTTEATIDTILYQRLKVAERDLMKMLQKIVFRKAGYMTRQQIYPVALVFWQLLRILCLGTSHLSNIVQRFKTKASGQADYQYMALKLLLSTHHALFRSSNPLLLNFSDKLNQDLLGGDEELIGLAKKMQKVVLSFREKGFPEMKGSIAFRKEYFDLFRGVYEGL